MNKLIALQRRITDMENQIGNDLIFLPFSKAILFFIYYLSYNWLYIIKINLIKIIRFNYIPWGLF